MVSARFKAGGPKPKALCGADTYYLIGPTGLLVPAVSEPALVPPDVRRGVASTRSARSSLAQTVCS